MTEPTKVSSNVTPILLAIGIFSALSIAAAITSQGFLEADACTHYLYSLFAFQQPHYFVDIWARPICTTIYAVPAVLMGRTGTQMLSLLLAIGCGFVAFFMARKQGHRWPALALIFTLAQPLVFLHSFCEMTELPFALLLGTGFLAYLNRQWLVFAILIGLTPLSRPEGFGFIILAAGALVIYRRWWWIPILVIPLFAWNYLGWLSFGSQGRWWTWLLDNWPYSAVSTYKPGPIYHFVKYLPVITSPLVLPAMLIGTWQYLARKNPHSSPLPAYWERGLVAIIPLMMLVGHSILYATGRMASNGELRYMLIVAPFWGVLSAQGWERIFSRAGWSHPFRFAGLVALVPILANLYYEVVPLKLTDDWRHARVAAEWYQQTSITKNYPLLATNHPAIRFYLSRIGSDWFRDRFASPEAGTVVIWDPSYSIHNSDERRVVPLEFLRQSGWIEITNRVAPVAADWHVFISPTDSQGRDAQETLRSLSSP